MAMTARQRWDHHFSCRDVEGASPLTQLCSKYQPLRMPADIRVRKGHSWSDQMGIAVGLLSDRNRDDLLTWVKDVSGPSLR